ncbi:MAG: kinase [Candidatus Methanomethylophilaceae archaeon]|nr:kinase [Candidatus Methanomethylophilaceae archaeon]
MVAVRYGVYTNLSIEGAVDISKEVISSLEGEDLVLESKLASVLGEEGVSLEDMDVDILVSVGGDGTILRAMQKNDAIILGVNAGSIGFLAEVGPDEIPDTMKKVRDGDYFIERRFKLRTDFRGERLADAVNEAVIHTDTIAKIRHFRIMVDDQVATELRADGVIVATPTGSTCYAMSVGGPIIDPHVNAFVFVPMAPFKFAARPMVVPTGARITVELLMDKGCLVVIDGQREYHIPGNSSVEFSLSKDYGRFIRFEDNFYARMQEKLVGSL